jgi:hypothetical protein
VWVLGSGERGRDLREGEGSLGISADGRAAAYRRMGDEEEDILGYKADRCDNR